MPDDINQIKSAYKWKYWRPNSGTIKIVWKTFVL